MARINKNILYSDQRPVIGIAFLLFGILILLKCQFALGMALGFSFIIGGILLIFIKPL